MMIYPGREGENKERVEKEGRGGVKVGCEGMQKVYILEQKKIKSRWVYVED
jgi:hypothetical protein